MATHKKDIYKQEDIELAAIAKAIGHPARIAILKILISKGNCICKEISDELPLAKSTVSQHLNELKKADLVIGEIQAPKICYQINTAKWNLVQKMFDGLIVKCC